MDDAMSEPVRTPPFAPFEWLLSGRYLRARRKEGFISVIAGFSFLGIMLGVATLIIVMAVMNGFRKELLDKILGLNGHLLVQPLESPLTDWKDVAERISQVAGIRLAAPVVDGQALASSPFNASGVFVRGIRADDLNNLTSIAKNVKQGSLEGFDEGQGVAIGRRLADQLSLHAGDSITLVAPRGAVTPMGTTPRIKPYKVAAVFEIGMSEYDSAIVFMPMPEAQLYFNRNGDVTAIEVYTNNPDRIDAFRKLDALAPGAAEVAKVTLARGVAADEEQVVLVGAAEDAGLADAGPEDLRVGRRHRQGRHLAGRQALVDPPGRHAEGLRA